MKYPPFGNDPRGNTGAAEMPFERVDDRCELGSDDRAVSIHQCQQSVGVAQVAHVAKLVDLVAANRSLAHPTEIPGDVLGRRREERHA